MFASSVRLGGSGRALQWQPYLGYARRLRPGLGWEVGAQYSRFTGSGYYDHAEVFAGLVSDRLGARIYYARDYFGRGPAWYAELNATHMLSDRLRVLGHVGLLRLSGAAETGEAAVRSGYDARIGLGRTFAAADAQLGWSVAGGNGRDPSGGRRDRSGWLLSLSHNW